MVATLLPALLLATRHALSAHPLRGNVLPSGGTEFLGIRFATMPERFEPSGPPLPWPSDPTAVTSFGPDCTQPTDMQRHATSEDCLYLNVYRPPLPSSASSVPSGGNQLLPVMVFVHGGGMVRGAGSWYNGSALAETQNVLLVTFNYRLGPLGFASANASGPHGTGSMNGVHDQITALQYVQANIHRFGGDPSRVTLFGQSAGGLSVCSLLFSPLARGLFSRAAIQSGSCTGPWGPGSNADGLAATARFLDAVAVGRSGVPASLTDLRDRQRFPATKLPSWSHGDLSSLEFPGYFVDGWVLMDSPASLSQHPASSKDRAYTVPYDELDALLIGSNSRDGMMACCEDSSSLPATLSAYGPALLKHWTVGVVSTLPTAINSTTLANGIAQQYQPADYGGTAAAAFVAADSDYNLYCPELQMLTLKRRRQWARPLIQQNVDGDKPRSYAYFWHYGPRCGVSPVPHSVPPLTGYDWAAHSAEVRFVFGASDGDPYGKADENCPFSPAERQLSAMTMDYWGSFVRDGTPTAYQHTTVGHEALPTWPMQEEEGRVMEFRLEGATVSTASFRAAECAFWSRET